MTKTAKTGREQRTWNGKGEAGRVTPETPAHETPKDDATNPTQALIDVLIERLVGMKNDPRERLLGRVLAYVGSAVLQELAETFWGGDSQGHSWYPLELLTFVFEDSELIEGRMSLLVANPKVRDTLATYFRGDPKVDAAVKRCRQGSG